jgi:hypothetical protein
MKPTILGSGMLLLAIGPSIATPRMATTWYCCVPAHEELPPGCHIECGPNVSCGGGTAAGIPTAGACVESPTSAQCNQAGNVHVPKHIWTCTATDCGAGKTQCDWGAPTGTQTESVKQCSGTNC